MFLLSLNFAQGECLVLDLNASESKSKFEKLENFEIWKRKRQRQTSVY